MRLGGMSHFNGPASTNNGWNHMGGPVPMNNGQAPMNNGMNPMGTQAPTGVINLVKGQKIDLTKSNPSLNKVTIGLGWDVADIPGVEFDLDASVFMVDNTGRTEPSGFIFYNNLRGPGVEHMGDNRTGAGDGDDEQVQITFSEVPANIEKIAISITIDRALERHQNFGMVRNAFARVVDNDTQREMIRFDLGEDFSTETAIIAVEFYRHNGFWKMSAVAQGYASDNKTEGLATLARSYGLNVG